MINFAAIFLHDTTDMQQIEFTLQPRPRGFHLITSEIIGHLPQLPQVGLLHLMVKHTSCGLAINENYDPDVRHDMALTMDRLVPEGQAGWQHTLEGDDDMPSHVKCVLTGATLTIPITNRALNLGTWQGIYLGEFRNHGGARHIVATILD